MPNVIPLERLERSILLIRGQKVMLDSDLAELYEVPTKRLNEQVRRNAARFPEDFMFQLNYQEVAALRSQIATLKLNALMSLTLNFKLPRSYTAYSWPIASIIWRYLPSIPNGNDFSPSIALFLFYLNHPE